MSAAVHRVYGQGFRALKAGTEPAWRRSPNPIASSPAMAFLNPFAPQSRMRFVPLTLASCQVIRSCFSNTLDGLNQASLINPLSITGVVLLRGVPEQCSSIPN